MKIIITICFFISQTFSYAQEIDIETFATGLNNPVSIKHAGDDRLFVAERNGRIQIVDANGNLNTIPFLDIDERVSDNGGEQGLLGLAFHPNYSSNGYFYVNYINNAGDTIISRFSRLDTDTADPNSELVLLEITQPFGNHNGGDMAFGPDGYLYISTGDGGAAGDPGDRSQNLSLLLGKLLRIDVNNTSNDKNYSIPLDNPFVEVTSAADEIYAYGLRNPWRFSFDRNTNDLWIADVGQYLYEEINKVSPTEAIEGLNFGWRCYEGFEVFDTSGNCPSNTNDLTFPIGVYSHSDDGDFKCSITGGYVYRGSEYPTLDGIYFFADVCSNEIGTLSNIEGVWEMSFTDNFYGNGWSCFGEDVNGELYIAGLDSGIIFKIIDSNLSIEEHLFSNIKIYQNLPENQITIELGNTFTQMDSIQFFDIKGKNVKTYTDFNSPTLQIENNALSSGIYLINFIALDGRVETKKLVITQ